MLMVVLHAKNIATFMTLFFKLLSKLFQLRPQCSSRFLHSALDVFVVRLNIVLSLYFYLDHGGGVSKGGAGVEL